MRPLIAGVFYCPQKEQKMHNRFIPTWLRQFKKTEKPTSTFTKELRDSFKRLTVLLKIASIISMSFALAEIGFVIWVFVR